MQLTHGSRALQSVARCRRSGFAGTRLSRRPQQWPLVVGVTSRYAQGGAGGAPQQPPGAAPPPVPPQQWQQQQQQWQPPQQQQWQPQQAAPQQRLPPATAPGPRRAAPPGRRVGVDLPPAAAPQSTGTVASAALQRVSAAVQPDQDLRITNVQRPAAAAGQGPVLLTRSQLMDKEVITR